MGLDTVMAPWLQDSAEDPTDVLTAHLSAFTGCLLNKVRSQNSTAHQNYARV